MACQIHSDIIIANCKQQQNVLFKSVGVFVDVQHYCMYHSSLITSPGLLIFSSHWDGEATI